MKTNFLASTSNNLENLKKTVLAKTVAYKEKHSALIKAQQSNANAAQNVKDLNNLYKFYYALETKTTEKYTIGITMKARS
jgi:hypothetical protein